MMVGSLQQLLLCWSLQSELSRFKWFLSWCLSFDQSRYCSEDGELRVSKRVWDRLDGDWGGGGAHPFQLGGGQEGRDIWCSVCLAHTIWYGVEGGGAVPRLDLYPLVQAHLQVHRIRADFSAFKILFQVKIFAWDIFGVMWDYLKTVEDICNTRRRDCVKTTYFETLLKVKVKTNLFYCFYIWFLSW